MIPIHTITRCTNTYTHIREQNTVPNLALKKLSFKEKVEIIPNVPDFYCVLEFGYLVLKLTDSVFFCIEEISV